MTASEEQDWGCDNCSQVNTEEEEYCKHCGLYRDHGTFETHSKVVAFDPNSPWDGPDWQ